MIEDFVSKMLREEAGKNLSYSSLQISYLTFCRINNINPVKFTDLTDFIKLKFNVQGTYDLLDITQMPFFPGLHLNLPEQDIQDYKKL